MEIHGSQQNWEESTEIFHISLAPILALPSCHQHPPPTYPPGHSGTFVTIDELTLKDHDHSKSIGFFMVLSWCTFYSLDKCIMTWNASRTTLLNRVFPLPQNPLFSTYLSFPSHNSWQPLIFSLSTVLPFSECHIIKIIQHVLSHCLLSLCNMHLNFLFVFPDLMAHFFLA